MKITDNYLFRRTPRYHIGGTVVNKVGLQVVRVLMRNLALSVRPSHVHRDVKEYVDILERDGVVVIPNFLPETHFSEIMRDYRQSRQEAQIGGYQTEWVHGLIRESRNFSAEQQRYPSFRKYIEENPCIYRIVSAVLKTRIKYSAPVYAEVFHNPAPTASNIDAENILHADLHFPTIKLWLYLSDVSAKNGALTYATGSHKLSNVRLAHEYDLSIRQAKLKNGREREFSERLLDRGRNKIDGAVLHKMGATEKQVCGKANTLVVTNNFGFHKRGVFHTTDLRETLTMSFRFVSSLHHRIYPRFSATARIGDTYKTGRVPAH